MTELNDLLHFGSAALSLGVSYAHIWKLARRQRIPVTKIGHNNFIRAADLNLVREECVRAGYLKLPTAGTGK